MIVNIINAKDVAEERLRQYTDKTKTKYEILLDETIERDGYWVFFYVSKESLEFENQSLSLAGNSPIIVDKYEGKVYATGTALPIQDYLKRFEEIELPKIISRSNLNQ